MGCFGYICPECNKNIRGGEMCVLKSVRHGNIMATTVGHYDEYGSTEEDEMFCENAECGTNSFDFNDSEYKISRGRIYNGEIISYLSFRSILINEQLDELSEITENIKRKTKKGEKVTDEDFAFLENLVLIDDEYVLKEWEKLEKPDRSLIKSGVSAYHKYCYDKLTEEEKAKCIISEDDPDQSWGQPRKEYL